MRQAGYDFQWFEHEDGRQALRASVSRGGQLRLGKGLRQALPARIRVGFDARVKVLAIADDPREGDPPPACGVMSARALAAAITATGLRLPVAFLLVRDETTGFYLGRVTPRRRMDPATGQRRYDVEQMCLLYSHVLDEAVRLLAKSTPYADRRAAALEAFSAAVAEYYPGCGEWEPYLAERVRRHLLRENRQHVRAAGQRSLDAPLTDEEGFCLYDTLSAADGGGIDQLEDRIMAEQFLASLSPREPTLARMLRGGFLLAQIAQSLALTEEEVLALGRQIAEKRRRFYQVA